jgi:hypothetical protein
MSQVTTQIQNAVVQQKLEDLLAFDRSKVGTIVARSNSRPRPRKKTPRPKQPKAPPREPQPFVLGINFPREFSLYPTKLCAGADASLCVCCVLSGRPAHIRAATRLLPCPQPPPHPPLASPMEGGQRSQHCTSTPTAGLGQLTCGCHVQVLAMESVRRPRSASSARGGKLLGEAGLTLEEYLWATRGFGLRPGESHRPQSHAA